MSQPWILNSSTMMMGVDVSHPDPGHQGDSMAAVVRTCKRSDPRVILIISIIEAFRLSGCITTQMRETSQFVTPLSLPSPLLLSLLSI